ncbi:hypothetical protein L5I01_17575 [Gordonia sp. HY442]|uniref:hypothetical protein n=1 Tax=Gordonia zhenghanii TaxID=2911516 RepID=UPI001F3CCC2C|nr:hypothetical protein [Gordonia zhenghanii]MCF8605167.1 hypothetical protein [Gordonia zhenghanii]
MVIAPPVGGLDRQRATRSTSYTPPDGGGWGLVPGWVSDPMFPVVVDSGTALVLLGNGSATISVSVDGAWQSARTLAIRVNGTTVATQSGGTTVSWSGSLSDGDRVELWASRGNSGVTITAGWIDITPV